MVSTMTSVAKVKIPEGYKQTEVGVIPEDWGIKTIEEITSIVGDGIHATPVYSMAGGYFFVNGNNIDQGKITLTENTKQIDYQEFIKHKKVLTNRTIFLSINGTIGNVGFYNDEPIILGKSAAYFNIKEGYSKFYIYYYLQTNEVGQFFEDGLTGTTIKNLGLGTIRSTPIALPPLREQTAIANALSDVDNLIAALETLIAKKSAIKTAAMQQLLTGKKRLPAFVKQGAKQNSELDNTSETAQAAQTKQTSTLNSDLYKESSEGLDSKSNQQSEVSNANNKQTAPRPGYKQTELGEIPEDWSCIESLEAMHFFGGYGFSSNLASSTGVKWLKIANVGLNEIKWDAESFLPERLVNDYKDFLLKPTDVVMALTRPILADKLKVARIEEADIPALLNQRVAKIEPKSYHQLDYLYYVVQRLNFVAAMNLAMAGTDPPNIGTNALAKIKIISPPTKEEQTAIANVLSDMDTELDSLQQRLSKAQKIKQGMMQELLTGKTRLV